MSYELTDDQMASFRENGFLFLPDVVDAQTLAALRADFGGWIDESRNHSEHYGVTYDGRPRFSLEPGHSAEQPALRRVSSPVDISENYLAFMRNNGALDAVEQLIGPNIAFENAKINSKQPGAATEVKFHQDFMFEPHTNDDLITVLYFLDDVTLENGPLEVVPGTHTGPLYSHWHDGVYTGAVSAAVAADAQPQAQPCHGPAGSACLMSTRLLHGSAPNRSQLPRTLLIIEYRADDAMPLQDNHVPCQYMGEIVRGEASNRGAVHALRDGVPRDAHQRFLLRATGQDRGHVMAGQREILRLRFEIDAGAGERARIGVVVLESDRTLEAELRLVDIDGVAFFHSRIPNDDHVTAETLLAMEARLPEAAGLLPRAFEFDVVGYGCTSASTQIGEGARCPSPASRTPGHAYDESNSGSDSGIARVGR